MFRRTVQRLQSELSGVKSVVAWQKKLRESIQAPNAETRPLNIDDNSAIQLRNDAPQGPSWQLFDHCASITRVYGLYERAIEDIVIEYLGLIPSILPTYADLEEVIRSNHRTGVGHILQKWSPAKSMYSNLAEGAIATGLHNGLAGNPYVILADAFLIDSDNYRVDTLNRLFGRMGLGDMFAGVRQADSVKKFCEISLAGTETADSFLNEFVRRRNEVAHGAVDSVVGVTEVELYADFTMLLVDSIAALLRKQILKTGCEHGRATLVGDVVRQWSNNVVGVEARASCVISVGTQLYVGVKHVHPVDVVSLRIVDDPKESIELQPNMQFGAGLSAPVAKGSQIYLWCGQPT